MCGCLCGTLTFPFALRSGVSGSHAVLVLGRLLSRSNYTSVYSHPLTQGDLFPQTLSSPTSVVSYFFLNLIILFSFFR